MINEKPGGKGTRQGLVLLLLVAAVGVLLLVFGDSLGNKAKGTEDAQNSADQYDANEYAVMLETRIRELCGEIEGAGNVTVFVSLKGGYRAVFAMDSQSTSSGYKSEIVMSGSGSDKSAVITAYQNPEIAGVGIVCDGGDSAYVRGQIISLVAATLDVSSNKIFVAAS